MSGLESVLSWDHIGTDTKSKELQEEYKRRFKVPWRNVQTAIDQGYIVPGWKLIDYLRATDQGDPNLKANPHNPDKPRKPFEYVNVWGKQGASKSAFCLQMLALLYDNWDTAIDRMIIDKQGLIDAYEEVPNADQRIPAACLDDLNTIISKQEWFVDKDFYIMFHRFLNTIRTKFGTVMSTLPNIAFTPDMLGDVISFEVIIYPNSSYKVERYCWDVDPFLAGQPKFTKIVVEYSSFDIYRTPATVWEKYQTKRATIANTLFTKMKEYMQEDRKEEEEKEENFACPNCGREMGNSYNLKVHVPKCQGKP